MGVNEHSAPAQLLLKRVIYGHRWSRHNVLIVQIGGHADDPPRLLADVDKFHHRIGPHHVVIHRILVRKHPLGHALAHNHDFLAVLSISVVEIASGDYGHAECGEKSG